MTPPGHVVHRVLAVCLALAVLLPVLVAWGLGLSSDDTRHDGVTATTGATATPTDPGRS